jgi:sensor c-di-GMP phosphodiesterase-like protein
VENPLTLQQLDLLGCHAAQGYHISRPVPPDQLISWLQQQTARPTPRPAIGGNGPQRHVPTSSP